MWFGQARTVVFGREGFQNVACLGAYLAAETCLSEKVREVTNCCSVWHFVVS